MTPIYYRTSFSRHVYSLAVNGFYARDLDADDFEFLEYVKVRGIANGTLPNTSIVSLEELEFWQLPYAIAPEIERKSGPIPRPIETPGQRAARQARTSVWHARRLIRQQERAIAEAELERERREWQKATEQRRLREKISDAEWEAANPLKRPKLFGKTINRHHVPQWKLDEQQQITIRQAQAQAAEQERREAIVEEARKTVEQAEQAASPITAWQLTGTKNELKSQIVTLAKSSRHFWSASDIARTLGCDRELLDLCLFELVRDGKLARRDP